MPAPATRVALRVAPGARRSEIVGRYGDGWKVRVAAAPERGRANQAVTRLVAEAMGVGRERVRLITGASARDKVVEVDGIAPDQAVRLLAAATRKGS